MKYKSKIPILAVATTAIFTVISMFKVRFPGWSEWWVAIWAFSPYLIIYWLTIRYSKKGNIWTISIAVYSILFSVITCYFTLHDLYLVYDPKSVLLFLFLPIIQYIILFITILITLVLSYLFNRKKQIPNKTYHQQ